MALPETNIQIILNDVTILDDEVMDEEEVGDIMKRQWRRSSWCPNEEKKKEEKQHKQKMILSVAGKRLEGGGGRLSGWMNGFERGR